MNLHRWRYSILLVGSIAVLLAAFLGKWVDPTLRAWTLTVGFGFLSAGLLGTGRKPLLAQLVALVLLVFCGFSALVAVPQSVAEVAENTRGLSQEQVKAATPAEGFETEPSDDGFHQAALITGLGGLTVFWTTLFLSLRPQPGIRRRARSPDLLLRVGRTLVFIGFIGVFAALVRFTATQLPTDDLFESVKSFWIGGTFLLLIATFAVPGFALWLQGLIGGGAGKSHYWQLGIFAALWVGLLIPTGQRGFLIALGLMLLAVLLGNRMIRSSTAVVVVLVGVVFIGLTQGLRNQVREEGQLTLGGFIERVSPNEWQDLYGYQIASFNWTMIMAQNRQSLDLPNSYLTLLEKPIPRSIFPEKSQGMGSEFTEKVYPDAFNQGVSFAIPFFAEAEFNLGLIGMIVASALLGVVLWSAERLIARRAPPLVEPIVLATIFWCLFEMVRGDTANAVAFSAAWVVPLVIFSRALGLRSRPAPQRLVIDATQVPRRFSGVGRLVMGIGKSLKQAPLPVQVEVVCGRDVRSLLADAFPASTVFRTPLRTSRPRVFRILYQQLILPLRFGAKTIILSPGDQAPIWGTSRLIFVICDLRRLDFPSSVESQREHSYYRSVMSIATRRADLIVTISQFSKSRINTYFSPRCSVDVVDISASSNFRVVKERDVKAAPAEFLVLGALRAYKGAYTIVRALSQVNEKNGRRPISMRFVGEVDQLLKEDLVRQVRRHSKGSVIFEGWRSDDEVSDLASSAAGSIYASEYEGYGLPVAESLSMGLPTIASDIPPHREIGDDAVLYFRPGDDSALAGLVTLIADDIALRADLAQAARLRWRWLEESGESWSEVLNRAIQGSTRQP